jgi:hypothetical protein
VHGVTLAEANEREMRTNAGQTLDLHSTPSVQNPSFLHHLHGEFTLG